MRSCAQGVVCLRMVCVLSYVQEEVLCVLCVHEYVEVNVVCIEEAWSVRCLVSLPLCSVCGAK